MKGRKNQREEEGELESMKGSCRGRRLGGGRKKRMLMKRYTLPDRERLKYTLLPGNEESDNMLNRNRKYEKMKLSRKFHPRFLNDVNFPLSSHSLSRLLFRYFYSATSSRFLRLCSSEKKKRFASWEEHCKNGRRQCFRN